MKASSKEEDYNHHQCFIIVVESYIPFSLFLWFKSPHVFDEATLQIKSKESNILKILFANIGINLHMVKDKISSIIRFRIHFMSQTRKLVEYSIRHSWVASIFNHLLIKILVDYIVLDSVVLLVQHLIGIIVLRVDKFFRFLRFGWSLER